MARALPLALLLLTVATGQLSAFSVGSHEKPEPQYQPEEEAAPAAQEEQQETGRSLFSSASIDSHSTQVESVVETEDADKKAFVEMINMLLWDADQEEEVTHEDGRQMHTQRFRRKGLLGQPMPEAFKDDESFSGRLYTTFTDQCYGLACQLGISSLAASINKMFG